MSENICIPKNYFIVLIFVFSFFTYIHSLRMINNSKIEKRQLYDNKMKEIDNSEDTEEDINSAESNQSMQTNDDDDGDIFIERDRKVINNILVAPERRLPRHAYPPRHFREMINIPTRGYPDNYQQLGVLVRKSDEKLLKLFGRQTHPGSNQYEYYVVDSNSNSDNKVPLKSPSKELNDGDKIDLPWLDSSRGQFDIKIFDYNAPRYNPYVV